MTAIAAVDLGAASGRVMLATISGSALQLTEVHRFPNEAVRVGGTLHWDVLSLYREIVVGLREAARLADGRLAGIGVDSWGVDYGLIDSGGALVGNPVHYRDSRTDGVMERVLGEVGGEHLYAITGVQNLPFNTIYQLMAASGTAQFDAASSLLLMPDLISFWLTGEVGVELTNASTTGLLDVRSRGWAYPLITSLGLDPALFPALRQPGDRIGEWKDGGVPVFAVGSHDTASAVVGVPADTDRFAYISCGTWSLVGVELDAPVLTEASRLANFTNELGVDGRVRYLRNVMGLWLLQESQRVWSATGLDADLGRLLADAARAPAFVSLVNPDDPSFLPPGDMPARIADLCRRTAQPVPVDPAATVRCVVESLALAHRRTVRAAAALSGRDVEVVHIVGGGARNALLCQLTADACGLPVVAGPVEATASGNVLVQARALGVIGGGLADLRSLLRRDADLVRYEPGGDTGAWASAEARIYPD
jgi:rhamnulokinase